MESHTRTHLHDGTSDTDRQCPQCGEYTVTTHWHRDTFKYGAGDSAPMLHVDLPVRRCDPCDFEFLDHEGEQLKHEAVCRHLGVLSPAETRAAFAEITGLVVTDPEVLSGTPCIAGTRVPAHDIADMIANGDTVAAIVASYPSLTEEQIYAACAYAGTHPRHVIPHYEPPWRKTKPYASNETPLDESKQES